MISVIIPSINAASRTIATVERVLALATASSTEVEVIVVDDGSTDGSAAVMEGILGGRSRVFANPTNLGRGGAINAGAALARHELLLILDCDCPPADERLFDAHLATLAADHDASAGVVTGRDASFWSQYLDRANQRRRNSGLAGQVHHMTSANLMIRRAAFEAIGGFDRRYGHFGFEDRDLFLRLLAAGKRVAVTPDARVIHDDEGVNLTSVVRKMAESGRYTSAVFRADHPAAYANLGYSAIDARDHRLRAWVLSVLMRTVLPSVAAVETILHAAWIPFSARVLLARLVWAASYADGTRLGLRDETRNS